MYLYLGEGVSKFGSAGKIVRDSIMENTDDLNNKSFANYRALMAKIPNTKFKNVIYKGLPKDKITFTQTIFKDQFKYETGKDLSQWQILPEMNTHNSFKVQKATTDFAGRSYTAWFTAELPFSEGPYKFNGLPGLIVKISDAQNHYVFELKEFKKLDERLPIKVPTKSVIETNKIRLTQLIQEDKENPLLAVESAGVRIGFSEKQKRELRDSRMRRNNPIELE